MERKTVMTCLAALLVLAFGLQTAGAQSPAVSEYWVKAGAAGDGTSRQNPSGKLHDLLAKAKRGDVFHVARGEYYGRADTGEFAVNVPNVTIVGGYDDGFGARNPFKNLTILKRKPGVNTDYTKTLGGIIAMDPEAHATGRIASCAGLILDGLILDGATRNDYAPQDKRLIANGSWKEPIVKLLASDAFMAANVKFRNCVVINGYYQGIYVKWHGDQNEISNCLIVNNMIYGIDMTGAQPERTSPEGHMAGASILIENNTVGYNWANDKSGSGQGMLLKGGGKVVNNIIAFLQGTRAAFVVSPEPRTVSGNVIWVTAETDSGQIPEGAEKADPGFLPELNYFESFTGNAAKFGTIPLDVVNPQRTARGLKTIDKVGAASAPENVAYGKEYPVNADLFAAFASKIPGKGFRTDVSFPSYAPRDAGLQGMKAAAPGEYQEVTFEQLKGKGNASALDGKRVKIRAGFNPRMMGRWLPKYGFSAVDHVAWELRKPGSSQENVSEKIMAYALIGSPASNRFNEVGSKTARKNTWSSGVTVYGILYAEGQGSYPWSLLVEAID